MDSTSTAIGNAAIRLTYAAVRAANAYEDGGAAKKEFGSAAKSFLRYWAKKVGLTNPSIKWNKGGPAVSGEVMLQTDKFEIWITDRSDANIMYRSRYQIKDGIHNDRWGSGCNMWASPTRFARVTLEEMENRLPAQY